MKTVNKAAACLLTGTIIASAFSPAVSAAEPKVSTDEAVYVNLDYYGATKNTSIVKGCSLNGNLEILDYGLYDRVSNMSNHVEPQLTADGVKWTLPEDAKDKRFYYECTPKEGTMELPWTFDVSYKLNGVPKKAEELAGASGMVEMNIECIPNEKAKTYYKNNMLLQCALMVNMEDHLSVEAPGSQTQGMGANRAVIFAALPGEHTTFTVRIGTESFETPGAVLMMIPGTLDQMKNIKDLKKAKDTVEDSANAIYTNMNEILDILNQLSGGLDDTKKGLENLDGARGTVSGSKGKVYANADEALADLSNTANQLTAMTPHLQNGQMLATEINANLNQLVTTLDGAKEHLAEFRQLVSSIQSDLTSLHDMLDDASSDSSKRKKAFNRLQDTLDRLSTNMNTLKSDLKKMQDSLINLESGLSRLKKELDSSSIPDSVKDQLYDMVDSLDGSVSHLETLVGNMKNSVDALKEICENGSDLVDSIRGVLEFDRAADLADDIHALGDTTKKALDLCIALIGNVDSLNDTLNRYEGDTVVLLKDTENLVQQLAKSVNSAVSFLNSFKDNLQNAGGKLDEGSRKTLNGMIDLLQKSIDAVNKSGNLKDQNDTIKNAVDSELDRYEEDNKFLFLDAETEKISFTSEKNPEPESIQVILRTDEISVDEVKDTVQDLEQKEDDGGFWGRIVSVFQNIWQSITSIFHRG